MSDGPWKTLGMSAGWRRVAKFAEMAASSSAEIAQSMTSALADDLKDVSPQLVSALRRFLGDDRQASMSFNEPGRLAALRVLGDGSPLGALMATYAGMMASEERLGTDGTREAVIRTLKERISRAVRQIEEHHCRESDDGRHTEVCERLVAAIDHIPFAELANQLLGMEATARRHSFQKFTGIDDGPRI